MKIDSIKALKDSIIEKISQNMTQVIVADEFSPRQLYSPLERPLITVYLKSASQKGVAMGRGDDENSMPAYGFIANIVIGFTIFSNGTASPNDLSSQLAGLILFDDSLDMQDFTCQRVSYNQDFEVTEQNCEGNFSCIFPQ